MTKTPPLPQPDAENSLVQALLRALARRASRRRFTRGHDPGMVTNGHAAVGDDE